MILWFCGCVINYKSPKPIINFVNLHFHRPARLWWFILYGSFGSRFATSLSMENVDFSIPWWKLWKTMFGCKWEMENGDQLHVISVILFFLLQGIFHASDPIWSEGRGDVAKRTLYYGVMSIFVSVQRKAKIMFSLGLFVCIRIRKISCCKC